MRSKEKLLKDINNISSKETLILYNNWLKWLLNQKKYSANTIASYSYDFKYFLNFISSHFSVNKIGLADLKKLEMKDFRSWLAFLKTLNPNLHPKSLARARASIKSFFSYGIYKKQIKSSADTYAFSKILSFLIVGIISFIALIIVLDTFKKPLTNIFPNLELLLFNLVESIKDIFLFFKNLLQ